MEWLALLIPLVAGGIVFARFGKRLTWWELLLPVAVGTIIIVATKWTAEWVQTRDTEYWGGYVTSATYYEPWDERVPCRHPRYRTELYTYSCGDSKRPRICTGTRQVQDGYQHFYDVDYHPADWVIADSNGEYQRISSAQFTTLCSQFGNRAFHPMYRSYYSINGNAYDTQWDGNDKTLEPVVTTHYYENRVAASDAVLKYRPVTDATRKARHLFEYPKVSGYRCPSVLPSGRWAGEAELEKLNALYGGKRQVRVWLLVFNNALDDTGALQEAYWQRGNKNELVITVGVNDAGMVQWSHVFCWCDDQTITADTESFLASGQSLDVAALSEWLGPEIDAKWKRKRFRDFSYITVRPSSLAITILYALVLLSTGGTYLWATRNKYVMRDRVTRGGHDAK